MEGAVRFEEEGGGEINKGENKERKTEVKVGEERGGKVGREEGEGEVRMKEGEELEANKKRQSERR